jgi:hypothetical protein
MCTFTMPDFPTLAGVFSLFKIFQMPLEDERVNSGNENASVTKNLSAGIKSFFGYLGCRSMPAVEDQASG